jgi:lipopolysaccharide transport system permease protein
MRLGVPILVQLWLLITPVMYPLSAVPGDARHFYTLNPMTGLIESFRRVLVFGQPPQVELLLPAIIGAVIALAVGSWYFAATESRFADVL